MRRLGSCRITSYHHVMLSDAGDGEDRSGVAIRRQEPSGVCLCRGGEATWGAWKVDRDLQPLRPSFATLWQRFAKPVLAGATLPVMVR